MDIWISLRGSSRRISAPWLASLPVGGELRVSLWEYGIPLCSRLWMKGFAQVAVRSGRDSAWMVGAGAGRAEFASIPPSVDRFRQTRQMG
ncbi:hypothetical protein [Streptomyces bicolor]|uniref:hypothetical protein n=1 Tax=Streptomyces bicolor TaxID=66874 RepID=UPI00131CA015|nr:hypothetical protein [Streptomyces bicolor]